MNIDHKRIVVTGAASGIGAALLAELSGHEVQIVAADINDARLRENVAAFGTAAAQITAVTCDLSVQQDADKLFEAAVHRMGGIDILIANAGFGYCERIERADWRHIEAIFQTNVLSPIYAVEKMAELEHESAYYVVITGSVLGRVALEGYTLYSSTKAALDRFAEGYRMEMGQDCRLALAYPLPVRTGFFKAAGNAPVPWLSQSADRVAKAIVRGVERDKEAIYTSPILPPMLWVDRLVPVARRLYQRMESRTFQRWWRSRSTSAP